MKFVVRVDDFGWTHEPHPLLPEPAKNWDLGLRAAQRFHEAMGGVPYLAAVIPAGLDEFGLAWLRSTAAANITTAVHGLTHARGEFEGLSVDGVREKIQTGNAVLRTSHYVPPFNVLDLSDHTFLEGAWHEGIRTIWGAPSWWSTPPQPRELHRGIRSIPSWGPLYGASAWRVHGCEASLIENAQHAIPEPGVAVLTLHLPWEFARDPQLNGLRRLVDIIRPHVIRPQEFPACA